MYEVVGMITVWGLVITVTMFSVSELTREFGYFVQRMVKDRPDLAAAYFLWAMTHGWFRKTPTATKIVVYKRHLRHISEELEKLQPSGGYREDV